MEELEWVVVNSYDDRRTIVNVALLRTHPMLLHEDCRIFRWISGLEEHPTMNSTTGTLKQQMQDLFINYHIHREEWLRFIQFLLVPQNVSRWAVDKIIEMCSRVGIYHLEHLVPRYNPMTPTEDVRQSYQWMVKNCNSYSTTEGWSAAGQVSNSPLLFYFRREK